MVSVKYILETFNKQGIDDLEIKQEGNLITIGYFHDSPVDCLKINGKLLTYIVFSRQEKLDWLFALLDNKVEIIDDYFDK